MKSDKVHIVDFEFRARLNEFLGGDHHNFCYQCGACVALCPAAEYSDDFNPRSIMLMAALGMRDTLLREDSPIWLCTNCYTCYERCPQDVRPVEVITALKNMCMEDNCAPDLIAKYSESILKSGMSTPMSSAIQRRREKFGLPEFRMNGYDELARLLQTEEDE